MSQPRHAVDRSSCAACPVRSAALCAGCEGADLTAWQERRRMQTFEAGEAVAHAGDKLDMMATVVAGSATLSRGMEDGRTQIVGLLLPANLLGRPGGGPLAHDVVASTPLTLCTVRNQDFAGLRSSQPDVGARFLEMTMADLEAARGWMTVLGRKTARERVASFLMMLAHREVVAGADPNGAIVFDVPLSREQAADYLGLTIETVSRQFTALRRDGVVDLPSKRGVRVLDLALLLAETGDDSDGGLPS